MKTSPLGRRPFSVSAVLLALSTAFLAGSAHAADIVKADNTTTLNNGASWVGGVAPTASDYAVFDSTITSPLSVGVGSNSTWAGIKFNSGADVTINSNGNTRLTLQPDTATTGEYTVLDLSSTSTNLTVTGVLFTLGANLGTGSTAILDIAAGRTLTIDAASDTKPSFSGSGSGEKTAKFTGGGNVVLAGIIGTTSTRTNIIVDNVNLTLNNTAYDSGSGSRTVSVINGGTLNVGTDTALITTAATINHIISLDNGTLTAANGAHSLVNNVTLEAGGGTLGGRDNLTLSGIVSGAGTLTKTDSSTLTLSGANTYTGGTVVDQGSIIYTQSFTTEGANGFSIDGAASTPVASADYGQIQASGGTFTYAGTLELTFTGAVAGTHTYDLFDFDGATQAGAFTGVSITGSYVAGLSRNGGLWAGVVDGVTFSFSEATGDLTVSGSAIPEPAACAALIGLAGLAFAAHRRRKAAR